MKKNIKLVITDLDGTLLTDDKRVTPKTKLVIEKLRAKGIIFGIATGRAKGAVDKLMPIYGLDKLLDAKIMMNGNIVSINDKTNYFYPLSPDDVLYIYKKGKKFKEKSFAVYDEGIDVIHCDNINQQVKEVAKNNLYDISIEDMDDWILGKSFLKCMYIGNNDYLMSIYNDVKRLETKNIKFLKSGPRMFEIFNINASKSFGIGKLCKEFNISINEVMALGDSENDIEMLRDCGIGVCMSNGMASVKNVADYITSFDNNHDGFAYFLEEYFDL